MKLEYMYKLNLPPINEILLDTFTGFVDEDPKAFNYQYLLNVNEIFKPEWLKYKGFSFDRALFFRKNNHVGKIHTDIPIQWMDTEYEQCTPWGITWVWDGPGTMAYWEFEDLERNYVTTGSHNLPRGQVWTFNGDSPPRKVYDQLPGCVYLVNGRMPHQATGWDSRRVVSLRTLEDHNMIPWEGIVEKFQDVIE